MAGKMWCCGGSSTGGGGGLTSITTADSTTVDLEGDGSAGAPLTATVKVHPFEPNGLTADPLGLIVRPSGDPDNAIGIGSDGNLFVPTPTDTTTVTGIAGTAPAPVSTTRSVDVDVTPDGAGGFQVGARLSPVWAQTGRVGMATVVSGTEGMITSLVVPEDGVYFMEASIEGIANIVSSVPSAERYVIGRLKVDGATMRQAHAMLNQFSTVDPESRFATSTVTLTWRRQLSAGQAIEAWALPFYDANGFGDGFGAAAALGYHKISD